MSNVSPVDWLFQKLWDTPKDKFDWHAILEDAKQMEKDQMQGMYVEGAFAQMRYFDGGEFISAEQYYNLKYKK